VRAVGRNSPFQDLYHRILTCSWAQYFAGFFGLLLAANAIFAGLYALQHNAISDASGGFWDAFSCSVQTLATVGYGAMAPATLYGHEIVTLERLAEKNAEIFLLSLIGLDDTFGTQIDARTRPGLDDVVEGRISRTSSSRSPTARA
jgi:hypothetical protein